jgi:hypothetical protein
VARRWLTGTAVMIVAALALLAGAAAADLDAATVTLQAADMPGAKITSKGVVKEAGYASAYHRSFEYNAPHGRAGVVTVDSESAVAATAAKAASNYQGLRRDLGTKSARTVFRKSVAAELKVKLDAVSIGVIHTPAVGDRAFQFALSVKLKATRIFVSFLYMQLDRVVSEFVTAAIRPIALSDAAYATAVAAHVGTALTPTLLTPPMVSGTPQQGQTLTAALGTSSASDATFAYQWQKCDAAGANCADIAGATAQTYLVAPPDVGSTLRVNLVATNRFGSSVPTPSAITAAVT